LQKSLAVLEPHASQQANDQDFVLALAQTYDILALAAEFAGRPDERRDWCTRMIPILEGTLRPQPRDASVRRLLADARGGRGVALVSLGKYAEAVPDFDRLVELSDGPERVLHRAHRALSRAFARDHAAACAEAWELAGLAGADGSFLYELVRIHCFALNWARQDDRLAEADRNKVVEDYERHAVALLAKA
jgi:hypothetical protein